MTNFWFSNDQENKCNPSTLIIPIWTFEFDIKLINKNSACYNDWNINYDDTNCVYSSKNIKVVNKWYIETVAEKITQTKTSNSSTSARKVNTWVPPIVIKKPEIIIEGGLNDKNECINKNNCKVNLRYAERSKFESCKWDFWWWVFSPWINTKCNPWFVEYWSW